MMTSKKKYETWPEWTDELGNTYQPGDIVAVATVSGRSPQMVIARVERINKFNSSGELITTNKYFTLDEPILHERKCYYKDRQYYGYSVDHVCKPSCTEYWQLSEIKKIPSCTVTATPIMDTRNFGRSMDHDGKVKAVTYSIPENILFLEKGSS